MKIRMFDGMVITPSKRTPTGVVTAPSIYVGTDEAPKGANQYETAIRVAKEKSGLSKYKSWQFG